MRDEVIMKANKGRRTNIVKHAIALDNYTLMNTMLINPFQKS